MQVIDLISDVAPWIDAVPNCCRARVKRTHVNHFAILTPKRSQSMEKRLLLLIVALVLCTPSFAQHSSTLTWNWSQGTGDPATSFILQRSTTTGGPYVTICGGTGQPVCPPVTQFTFTDSTVAGGSTYFYVVEASGPGGVSAPSNEVKAVIPFLPPSAPQSLQSQSR